MPKLSVAKRWFRIVQKDISRIPEAIDYYLSEVSKSDDAISQNGNIEKLNRDLPGLIAYYDTIHTDAESVMVVVERLVKQEKVRAFKDLLERPPSQRSLTTTELKMMAEVDPDVVILQEILEDIRNAHGQLDSVMKALVQKGYTLTNIKDIRKGGFQEVEI